MEWLIAGFVAVWLLGWVCTMKETQTDGGWFMRWIIGPIVVLIAWPYIAWQMMRQMG